VAIYRGFYYNVNMTNQVKNSSWILHDIKILREFVTSQVRVSLNLTF
jgi:hypothetical protein